MGMENAHNYFLQILSEQGLLGFSLFMLLLTYCLARLYRNGNKLAFYAMLGVLATNIYGHSLLVSSLFILFYILAFSFYPKNAPSKFVLDKSFLRGKWWVGLVTVLVVMGALYEVWSSPSRLPYAGSPICYKPQSFKRYWTTGQSRFQLRSIFETSPISYFVSHPNLDKNPVTVSVDIWLKDMHFKNMTRTFYEPMRMSEVVDYPKQFEGPIWIEARVSRCFIEKNLGISLDNRPLGIQFDLTLNENGT